MNDTFADVNLESLEEIGEVKTVGVEGNAEKTEGWKDEKDRCRDEDRGEKSREECPSDALAVRDSRACFKVGWKPAGGASL
jgi:hypothetical protein